MQPTIQVSLKKRALDSIGAQRIGTAGSYLKTQGRCQSIISEMRSIAQRIAERSALLEPLNARGIKGRQTRRASVMLKACLRHDAPPSGGALTSTCAPIPRLSDMATIKRHRSPRAAPPRATSACAAWCLTLHGAGASSTIRPGPRAGASGPTRAGGKAPDHVRDATHPAPPHAQQRNHLHLNSIA